jgi:hypothetical protein
MRRSPSIVPDRDDCEIYLVLDDFGGHFGLCLAGGRRGPARGPFTAKNKSWRGGQSATASMISSDDHAESARLYVAAYGQRDRTFCPINEQTGDSGGLGCRWVR